MRNLLSVGSPTVVGVATAATYPISGSKGTTDHSPRVEAAPACPHRRPAQAQQGLPRRSYAPANPTPSALT
jgi:hypothetical protein